MNIIIYAAFVLGLFLALAGILHFGVLCVPMTIVMGGGMLATLGSLAATIAAIGFGFHLMDEMYERIQDRK